MQSVIGVYPSFGEAQRAVRVLERSELSIQDIVVAEERKRMGRRSRLSDAQRDLVNDLRGGFLVIMNGKAENIARATELLLRPQSP